MPSPVDATYPYDLCVIGSGPAGQKAAIQAAKLGKRVIVVEARPVLGGAAVNTGTIPSKALREAVLNRVQGGLNGGGSSGGGRPSLSGLWADAREVIDLEVRMVRQQLERNGVQVVVNAAARFVDANTIEAVPSDGHSSGGYGAVNRISAAKFLIAVGTCPARPSSIAFDDREIITSDEILHLKSLPYSMIIVGGGVIGTEYASMMAALGVKVTLIEGRPRLLEFVDSEIVEALQYHLRQSGVTLRLGEKVVKIAKVEALAGSRTENGFQAEAILESGKVLRADTLMYCIGRQGNTDSLNLPAAGLNADSRGRVVVNEFYQTAQPHIYAAGDAIGFPALASTSMDQGRAAACHAFGVRCERGGELLPYGIYSIPEISMVGWTEEKLTQEGIPYESGIAQYKEIARGQLLRDDVGMLKLLIHPESHAVLGVHVIGSGATELVHIGQAVMAFKGTAEYFVNTVFNYPTLAECYKVAALNGLNKINGV